MLVTAWLYHWILFLMVVVPIATVGLFLSDNLASTDESGIDRVAGADNPRSVETGIVDLSVILGIRRYR